MRKTRLKVSWLGIPCSSTRIVRNSASFARPNSAMSQQVGTAQRGQQRNKQHLGQIVLCLVLPRIDQRQKAFCKAVQNSPLSNQETLSESNFPSKAIAWPIEHAIPLPARGRVNTVTACGRNRRCPLSPSWFR